jgi:hypothetical protein
VLTKRIINLARVSDNFLSRLENREVALWIRSLPKDAAIRRQLVDFLGLPWRLVLSEDYDAAIFAALEQVVSFSDPMARKRGFVHVIDGDPSRMELPQRCLPIYLLNGRKSGPVSSDFESRLRRMTMLEVLRRSGVHELLFISGESSELFPPEVKELWASGFRCQVTVASTLPETSSALIASLELMEGINAATVVGLTSSEVIADILRRYGATYPEDRKVIRMRDARGTFTKVDVTDADEPERPISEWYSLIGERDLALITPEELSEDDLIGFFRDPTSSWRPYAAGVPWIRDARCGDHLKNLLRKLDSDGPQEDRIAYISSESGAGGTTLARALAWESARLGYPVLLAKPIPFVPDALPVINFLSRVHNVAERQHGAGPDSSPGSPAREREAAPRRYETPWVVVFDSLHWQHRDSELIHFRNQLEKAGRPVCMLVVTGTAPLLSLHGGSISKLAELNHNIEIDEAQALGVHLNRFLKVYGKQRQTWQWENFHKEHTVRYVDGIAAFWVTLSFWVQGQYDLSESIQEWMYRAFKANAPEREIKEAILRIAALSSERLPIPDILLPPSPNAWPMSQLLSDARSRLAPLGLVRVSSEGEGYWALVHDILGRFLINAFFYDGPLREEMGFGSAQNPEHLRYLLLRQISRERALGERAYRSIGEDFATTIFKIDPDHGHGGFVSIWREILEALDEMPGSLRDTSRLFRHHTAISRRRIAKLDERFYEITLAERITLLNRAIDDINYALNFIDYSPGTESNLNLLNSLANAYFDLAEAESQLGADQTRINELRKLANEATRRAYGENPTNSFVIETYVKNLLSSARVSAGEAVEHCLEALGILFSALASNEAAYRAAQLGSLADQALSILFRQAVASVEHSEPKSALDVLVQAWIRLREGDRRQGLDLSDVPPENVARAIETLGHPAGKGNMQVIRLRYDLVSLSQPHDFRQQIELIEQLQATEYRMSPQLKLEYAILLFQNSRPLEGEKAFRILRQLWRENEVYVRVPDRLRWLRAPDGKSLQAVQATAASEYGSRASARVREFGAGIVFFRPEEHGFRNVTVGTRFTCHVSFGHNGPFLRPVTASVAESSSPIRG